MIPHTIPTWQHKSWQEQLTNQITKPADLLSRLSLDNQWLPAAERAAALFPLRVSEAFVSRMRPGDPNDPLLLQVLPLGEEFAVTPGYSEDPLEEEKSNPAPGLIHKYHGRVLLIAAPHCAINCRYCFRRHFDYRQNTPSRTEWQAALAYIKIRPEIDEVILSGGDPLMLGDKQLRWLLTEIDAIPHITRIRIHSRLPVVLPDRFTSTLLQLLSSTRAQMVVVAHCNHSQEIDQSVEAVFEALKQAGITLLNQTVLLKNINDSANILIELSKRLFQSGVLPYYLHLLDRVSGTAHYEVDELDARRLREELLAQLPGYLVPTLVKEEPGAPSKTPIR